MATVACQGSLPSGVSQRLVRTLVSMTLRAAGAKVPPGAAIAVSAVGDARMRGLNRAYRGKDRTTDVLSFAYGDDFPAPGRGGTEFGEIVISVPQVRRQAKRFGRSVKDEFALMVVHGTLHLLGHDHETEAQEREMFGLQHDILIRAGIL
jgi:probable rRNA maturation factor